MTRWIFLLLILSGWAILLDGCGTSPPIRYYQLSALPLSNNQVIAESGKHRTMIGIGPVDIPPYVDRLQLVTRAGPHVLDLSEFDRWAEPLETDVKRVIVENLSQLFAGERAAVVVWDGGIPLDYQVRIEVTRFDFLKSGEAVLNARWTVAGKNEGETLILKTSGFTHPAPSDDYALMVGAMSRNLESLSQEIRSALKPLL